MSRAPVFVLGAGVAGLTAASQLARRGVAHRIVEAGPRIAGMADSLMGADGFSYDIGAHFITNRFAAACGISSNCLTLASYGELFHLGAGRDLRYPFGLLKSPHFVSSAVVRRLADWRTGHGPFASVAERFAHEYGPAVAAEVANPVVESWCGLPADELAPSVAEKIPQGLMRTIWLRAAQSLTHRAVAIGYCRDRPESAGVYHVYPAQGLVEVCRALAATLPAPVELSQPAQKIYVDGGRVVGVRLAGVDHDAAAVISTLPINRLHQLVEGSSSAQRFAALRFRGLVLVNLKLDGHHLLPETIVWTPTGYPFFRLTEAPRAMPWLAPPGKTIVLCEMGAQPGEAVWTLPDDEAIRRCCASLAEFIPDVEQRLIGAQVMRQPLGYPIFARAYEAERQDLADHGVGIDGLLSIGRNGEFDHLLMEDIYWRTVRMVERLSLGLQGHLGDALRAGQRPRPDQAPAMLGAA